MPENCVAKFDQDFVSISCIDNTVLCIRSCAKLLIEYASPPDDSILACANFEASCEFLFSKILFSFSNCRVLVFSDSNSVVIDLVFFPNSIIFFAAWPVFDAPFEALSNDFKMSYRSKHIFNRKSSDWNSAGKASHYVGFECVSFIGRILNGTPGS